MRILSSIRKKYHPLNIIYLDSENLLANVREFQNLSGKPVIPVLKGNAYGHGIKQISQILHGSDVELIAVDSYHEANQIRKVCKKPILVMGYIDPDSLDLLRYGNISYVIQDIASLKKLAGLGRKAKIHLELNTGMNRLGLSSKTEINAYLAIIRENSNLILDGVMTHLANADSIDDKFSAKQTELFDELVGHILAEGFSPTFIHIAQTAGSVKVTSKYANFVRVGLGIYGINPFAPNDPNYKKLANLRPVLSLESQIIKINNLAPGDSISYNCTFTAKKPMRIATLPMGYYEGVPRELSNTGIFLHKNQPLQIVGRVCMNHTMIDITDTDLQVGDCVTAMSNQPKDPNSIQNIAQEHSLFIYGLLSRISSSIHRTID